MYSLTHRRPTRALQLGTVAIGGDNAVSVQSMANTPTADVSATVEQIRRLALAGCDIVRLAVPDIEAAAALPAIRRAVNVPLVADIHFDYKLALAAIDANFDGLRLNPGNIGSDENVRKVVEAARERRIPIRIGVNSGSVPKDVLARMGMTAEALVESAMQHVRILEDLNYPEIKISVKASSVPLTIAAYRLLSETVDYPLHLGVTEAGTEYVGSIKSSIGIGTLLAEGIGDTIRVSLTDDPVKEATLALEILKALGLRSGLNLVSCPTCGRTRIDLIGLAQRTGKRLAPWRDVPITVAVMGCVVNGPGESREADYGIAGGIGEGLLFRSGEIVGKVPEDKLIDALIELIRTDHPVP
jgi:(E)-4-hydroxy-3-methylbut-2-enyl-diphosphate synthase